MPSTRSSARSQEGGNASPKSDSSVSGTKRKVDEVTSPTATKAKRDTGAKKQKTLEESMPSDEAVAQELNGEDQANKSEAKQSNGHTGEASDEKHDDDMEIDGDDEPEGKQAGDAEANGSEHKDEKAHDDKEKSIQQDSAKVSSMQLLEALTCTDNSLVRDRRVEATSQWRVQRRCRRKCCREGLIPRTGHAVEYPREGHHPLLHSRQSWCR
jgi:hypothetical protein